MAILKIIRSNEYVNRVRDIKLYIDGTKLETIKNGQAKEFTITPGDHVLQAKIDWCSSSKIIFSISENEMKVFDLSSFAKGKSLKGLSLLYHIIFAPSKYLRLDEVKG